MTAGGGTVLPATPVVTDASGIATVGSWTLGPTQGAETLSATATGSDIAGNPVLFAATGLAFTQQGPKLVGTGAVGTAVQGYSVSLSADGNTAIVGGFADNGECWGRVGLDPKRGGVDPAGVQAGRHGRLGAANQGFSVSLSADGNTAIVGGVRRGGLGPRGSGPGAEASGPSRGPSWSARAPSGPPTRAFRVPLRDGNTAIVGGYSDNGDAGAAWVWTRSGGVWTQQGSKLVGTGAVGAA